MRTKDKERIDQRLARCSQTTFRGIYADYYQEDVPILVEIIRNLIERLRRERTRTNGGVG